jgi:hypothetical protein
VLAIVGFAIQGEPPDVSDDSPREIVDFYADNDTSVMIGAALAAAAGGLFVYFAAFIRSLLTATDRSFLPNVAFAGVVIFATGVAIDSTISFTLADSADDIGRSSVVTLAALYENDFVPFALGLLLFLSATGISTVRHGGAIPKWLGWVCILLAVIALTPIGFAAFIGAALVVLVLSVLLTVRAGRSGTIPADEPGPTAT